MKKLYKLIGILLSVSVITGCSSSMQQPISIQDFNSLDVGTLSSKTNVSKKSDYRKQDISIKMNQFSPVPEKGMKWTYNLERVYSNVSNSSKIEISIVDEDNKGFTVDVNGMVITINRTQFWSILNLVFIHEYHNDDFAWYNLPGHPNNDDLKNGTYLLYRQCNSANSCGGFEVEVPSGKYIVEKILVQEYVNPLDPNSGNNNLSWENSHFWINKKIGVVEMKLQTPSNPNLGVTTLKLLKTNIK